MANGFDWKKLVGGFAPALATALGGPLAGMAVATIGKALGIDDPTEDKLEAALKTADPAILLKIKEANVEFEKHMATVGVDLTKLAVQDRDSARQMLVQTRAKTPAVLSYFVVVATIGIYSFLLSGDYEKLTISELILGRILGTLDMAFGVVLAYWLGAAHREPANRAPTNGKG